MRTAHPLSHAGLDPILRTEPAGPKPIVVSGTHPPAAAGPVLVALDDDDNAGALLRHGHRLAAQLGVALRAAYVWSDCHHDLAEADRFLCGLLEEHLTVDQARYVERDVIHHGDPAEALIALSTSPSRLVVGSSSGSPGSCSTLGATTWAILGRTRCPVVVVPHRRRSATRVGW